MKKFIRITAIGLGIGLCAVLVAMTISIRNDIGPSPACRRANRASPVAGEVVARTLTSNGIERCYQLYTPPLTDSPRPLIIMLHGLASNSKTSLIVGQWNQIAERENLIIAYPEGTLVPQRWNADRRWLAEADDTRFLIDVVNDVAGLLPVNRSRVYLTGFSNGAAMTMVAACQASNIFAAIGPVEGVLTQEQLENCELERPVPAVLFYGTSAEGTFNPRSMAIPRAPLYFLLRVSPEQIPEPTPAEWAAAWQAYNHCLSGPSLTDLGQGVSLHSYTDCADDAEVYLYIIEEMGHQWPGGGEVPIGGPYSDAIDATEKMWDFFHTHRLPVQ